MVGPVTACGSCGEEELEKILDLGLQPLPQAVPGRDSSARFPLRLVRCWLCGLVQLDYIVPQEELFPADYPYATGNTRELRDHFTFLAGSIAGLVNTGDLVVDIGGNDGTLLRKLDREWVGADGATVRPRCLLVEPTDQARKARQAGIATLQDYFTAKVAEGIRGDLGQAAVIVTSNTFGHVQEPHDFLNGITELLAPDGTLIIENQDWQHVVNGLQIDTIYHEHLRYYTPASLSWLLGRHGLLVTAWQPLRMHGGSFRATVVREQPELQCRAMRLASRFTELVRQAAGKGPVYAVGAPTRATPLVNYTGIGQYLDCACEIAGSAKIGALIPGTDVPVVDEERLFTDQPPNVVLLAWDLADTLIPKLRERGFTGNVIVPLPEPEVLDG